MENNEDVEVKDNITLTNEGSRPEASVENDATADQRGIDIMDCDAAEVVEVNRLILVVSLIQDKLKIPGEEIWRKYQRTQTTKVTAHPISVITQRVGMTK